MTLFQEIKSLVIRIAIFDMLFLFGSGTHTATLSSPNPVPISDENPMCRTYQLMICIGLAFMRKFLYREQIFRAAGTSDGSFVEFQCEESLQMDVFEEQLEVILQDDGP
jgi:hypothetical protein